MAKRKRIDWDSHEDEIRQLYVEDNLTLEETAAEMEKRGFVAPMREFKRRFLGYKHLKATEWVLIGHEIERRKRQENKESEVFLRGTRLDPDGVKRKIARYKDKSQDIDLNQADEVIGKSIEDRIYIRTPPIPGDTAVPLVSTQSTISTDVTSQTDPPLDVPFPRRPSASNVHDTPSFLELQSIEDPYLREIDLVVSPGLCHDISETTDWLDLLNSSSWNGIVTRGPSPIAASCGPMEMSASPGLLLDEPYPATRDDDFSLYRAIDMTTRLFKLNLTRNLPWFNFQRLISHTGLFSVIQTSPGFHPFSRVSTGSQNAPLIDRPSILSSILGISTKADIRNSTQHFTSVLQNTIPERQDGEVSRKVQQLFDPRNKHPLLQILDIAAYLLSNNMITEEQTDTFLKWMIDGRHTHMLLRFLLQNSATVHAASTRILESVIRIEDITFLKLLIDVGIKFDTALESVTEFYDPIFFAHLLKFGVKQGSLSGALGGFLLIKVARTPFVEIAQVLIEHGADVHMSYESALQNAIKFRHIKMVRCLINAGALDEFCDPEAPSEFLSWAVHRREFDIVLELIEGGAKVPNGTVEKDILQHSALYDEGIHRKLLIKLKGSMHGPVIHTVIARDLFRAARDGVGRFSSFVASYRDQLTKDMMELAFFDAICSLNCTVVQIFLGSQIFWQLGVDLNKSAFNSSYRPLRLAASLSCREAWQNSGYSCIYLVGAKFSEEDNRGEHINNPCIFGAESCCRLLIHSGADVNFPGLLADVVEDGSFDILRLLVDEGADLEIYGVHAIEEAINNNDVRIVAFLLDRGIDVNSIGSHLSLLQVAALNGRVELAQYLIERGANVNAPAQPVEGRTALQAAVLHGSYDMVAFLLARNVELDAPAALVKGLSLLEASMRIHSDLEEAIQIFKLLRDKGAFEKANKNIPIWADLIVHDHREMIHLALEAGINVNQITETFPSFSPETPLQLAAGLGNLELVKLFLNYGADINAPPAYGHGRTALQAAASCPVLHIELIQFLINKEADIHAPAGVVGGVTALQGAAIRGHIKIATMLLERGVDINARAALEEGRTAVEGAAECGRLDMVQLLLNAGATGDVVRKTGFKKAIEYAEKNRHFAVAQLLRDHEAKQNN